jgi:hypothetical protein
MPLIDSDLTYKVPILLGVGLFPSNQSHSTFDIPRSVGQSLSEHGRCLHLKYIHSQDKV